MKREDLVDGCWNDSECFVIGGGPSLQFFDFRKLAGRRVIDCNASTLARTKDETPFWRFHPDIALIMDRRVVDALEDIQIWREWQAGLKVWVSEEECLRDKPYTGVLQLQPTPKHEWGTSLFTGIRRLSNVGVTAINFAFLTGANPIYLLGFDGKAEEGHSKMPHWHQNYPEQWKTPATQFETFNKHIEDTAKHCWEAVINLNPTSAIRGFRFEYPEDILR